MPRSSTSVRALRVVLDIEPITDVLPVAIDRQRLACQSFDDHVRDQLFGEMVRPVIVRAVGDECRQPVSFMPGAHQMVG